MSNLHLSITNLSVAVQDKPVLQDISLCCVGGSTHALMGPNGSGKSSLALSVAGYPGYEVTAGSMQFDNQCLLSLSAHERARLGIFLGFQQPPAIPGLSVELFIQAMVKHASVPNESVTQLQERMAHAFTLVGLPVHFMGRHVNEGFSGGERKRFELAQAIIMRPRCLILDEIDSGLDIDALGSITAALSYLRTCNPDMITLCITHYTRVLQAVGCDQVHILSSGCLRESGGHDLAHVIDHKGYQPWQ